ncbi:MAG: formate dehydrogenase major subunit [Candidatus Nitrosomirales archaeon]|jgi:formate dehydrogenase major subunit
MMREEETVCPYCGVGCGITITISDGVPTKVRGVKDHPVSRGHLCAKGFAALDILRSKDRLTHPLKRRGDSFERTSWSEALSEIASHIKKIIEKHGADALGFSGGCLCTNEENYLIQKLARRIGTNNVESCARLCHQPSVHALKRAVGFGAASTTMSSMKDSKLLLFIGSSLADSHPILTQYVMEAKNRGAKVIDVDPRGPSFAKFADLHLKVAPGTDIALLNAIANVIINEGLENKEFINKRTNDYEEFRNSVEKYTPEKVAKIIEIEPVLVLQAARLYATSGGSLILVGIGITEQAQGTDAVAAAINLALLTGNYGRVGTGVCPLRGQANVQGAGDVGASSEFFPGGMPVDQTNAKALEEIWGFKVPSKMGITMMEMISKAVDGEIKGLYIMGFNPIHSLPNRTVTEKAMSSLELLVVQDIFMSATAAMAHYVLPAASWLEREGSMTNMDRTVQWRRQLLDPVSETKPDWRILIELAKYFGYHEFNYASPRDVLEEISHVVKPYSGITWDILSRNSEVRYPLVDGSSTDVLFTERFHTPDGRAKFTAVEYLPVQLTTDEFPFVLTTGRVISRYNTDIMTSKSERLLIPGTDINYVEVNPDDAENIGLKEGDHALMKSRFGQVVLNVKITNAVRKGMFFAPMHGGKVNYVTGGCLDSSAKTPCYKWTAVNLTKV